MTNRHYPDVTANPDFPALEEDVLHFWNHENVFRRSVDNRPAEKGGKSNEYIFYDGPPFANGLPHYGHMLTGFVKDLFARYHTMKGARVERRFGWDCHGLPAEMAAEKELGISGRVQILGYGIDKFNAHCQTSVMKYTKDWEYYVTRAGRWVDFENDYKTMDPSFMESSIWAFKQLFDKGLVYESYRVMPYSWAAETPLSNFETRLDNSYRERTDKAVTVAFKLKEKPEGAPEADEYYVLAWTTTPWTLPSNLALAASKDVKYMAVVKPATLTQPSPLKGEGLRDKPYVAEHIERARKLRENATDAEQLLWSLLRDRQLENIKFRRQQPIGKYIADFCSPEQKLIVELDGGQHVEQESYDKGRTAFLEAEGYRVLRFWNNDVLLNLEGVTEEILKSLSSTNPKALSLEGRGLGEGGGTKICYLLAENGLSKYAKGLDLEFIKPTHRNVYWYFDGKNITEKNIPDNAIPTAGNTAYLSEVSGSSLIGLSYEPLFPYFADNPNAFRILDGSDFIEEGEGTGIVHMSPGFGEDDQRICAANGIAVVCPVDQAGRYTDEIYDLPDLSLKGLNVVAQTEGKRTDEPYNEKQLLQYGLVNLRIVTWLKSHGHLIDQQDYTHNYPHCWRTDTPLIYRAMSSWYVEVTKFKDRMVELNQQINWIPGHVKDGLFGKWLENARDWSISRNRFWGCPLPVWRSDNPDNKKLYVFGSVKELEDFFGQKVENLHRPYIDELTAPDPENPQYTLRRIEDVFDCWFESGSMPYGQVHYPFEREEWFEHHFPADFIVEYAAQTRGWFYTLMVLGTALFDKPPFLNCICHGVVVDENGQKLSKRLQNYQDLNTIFKSHGADALRWTMLSSPVMRGQELRIDYEANIVRDALRLSIKPVWNAYNFFTLYANADGVKANFISDFSKIDNPMDRYILSKARDGVEAVTKALDAYDTPAACAAVGEFFEVLNNWYIRRNRQRFWKKEQDGDKRTAYDTLYTVLHAMTRAASPLIPFVTEAIFAGLVHEGRFKAEASVHLADWPDVSAWPKENALVEEMDRVRDVCNVALSIRNEKNLRVRLPLGGITVVAQESERLKPYTALIQDEVNVKKIDFSDDVASQGSLVLKLDFKALGARLGAKMKEVAGAAKQGKWTKTPDGGIEVAGERLSPEEYTLLLDPKDKEQARPLPTQDALVILDTHVTPELVQEGLARDLIRMIQQARKDANLDISDRINLHLSAENGLAEVITKHRDFIAEQVLAKKLDALSNDNLPHRFENEVDGQKVVIGFEVAA